MLADFAISLLNKETKYIASNMQKIIIIYYYFM